MLGNSKEELCDSQVVCIVLYLPYSERNNHRAVVPWRIPLSLTIVPSVVKSLVAPTSGKGKILSDSWNIILHIDTVLQLF